MPTNSAACHHLIFPDVARNNTSCNFIARSIAVIETHAPRMAPSSPPEKRTYHQLRTPDILCANDSALPCSNEVVINGTGYPFDSGIPNRLVVWLFSRLMAESTTVVCKL